MSEEALPMSTSVSVQTVRIKKKARTAEAHFGDRVFYWVLKGISWSLILLILGIVYMLVDMAAPTLGKFGWKFLVGNDWNPPADVFGGLPFIYGTVVSSLIAIALAAPISVGIALFLTELAPRWLSRILGFLVEMLAAIPSVVYGLWGIFILAPFMQKSVMPFLSSWLGPDTSFAVGFGYVLIAIAYPFVLISNLFGFSQLTLGRLSDILLDVAGKLFAGPGFGVGLLTASIVLAIMITPTIAAITREVFRTVQPTVKEAALALGATRWETMKMAVLASTKSGILGACILGLGRAMGETMAVTMVIGNRNEITAKLLAPAQTMASVIANEYPEASGLHMASLAAIGLSLFAVSFVINSIARFIIWRVEGERGGRAT